MRICEPIPDGAQEKSFGDTHTIITKYTMNKMDQGHAGTEGSSRPAPYPYRGLF